MSGKPIECREMLKHEPGMVEDDSHMVIPRLVETGPFPGCCPKHTLSIYQFRSTAQSGGRGKHDRMSLVIRRSPRVNQEALLRATFFG